ncbi:hypothetical protein BN1013_01922 [Candidatus Rubidus massiliensis]|nr:hypothetical protein BN1013_01922 [Candidatus Rubidus massiliensis]
MPKVTSWNTLKSQAIHNKVTVEDLVNYKSTDNPFKRLWINITRLFQGKGILTDQKIKELLGNLSEETIQKITDSCALILSQSSKQEKPISFKASTNEIDDVEKIRFATKIFNIEDKVELFKQDGHGFYLSDEPLNKIKAQKQRGDIQSKFFNYLEQKFTSIENFFTSFLAIIPKTSFGKKLDSNTLQSETKIERGTKENPLDRYQPKDANDVDPKNHLLKATTSNGDQIILGSGYPIIDGIRDRDPLCDDMVLQRFSNYILFSGTDGSGANEFTKKGAIEANQVFLKTMQQELSQKDSLTTRDVTSASFKGIQDIQKKLVKLLGPLTTHIGITATQDENGNVKGVITSVGDMKVFIKKANGDVVDLTKGNRGGEDPRDPGGQLGGPDLHNADYRNLRVIPFTASKGDVLLPMSDGIHDNLNGDQEALIKQLLENKTPQEYAQTLIDHAIDYSSAKRQSFVTNLEENMDISGKMDHLSVAQIML